MFVTVARVRATAMATDSLTGRVALVTGGAGGIGAAVAASLRAVGATVVAVDRQGVPREGIDAAAADRPGTVLQMDVTDRASIASLVLDLERVWGSVDILVNAAGVVSFGDAEHLDESEWDRVLDINLKGSFLPCQAVLGGMKQRRRGRIVNIGSVIGKNGGNARPWLDPDEQRVAGNVAYGVSKAGVHAMTSFLAKELASFGVTVNAIAPGPIATAMTNTFPSHLQALIPVGRMGTVADVTRAVLFLVADEAGFISGEVLDLNGAMWCD
jgi:3-oxoacyl-[acyl-carrier protein] reductase